MPSQERQFQRCTPSKVPKKRGKGVGECLKKGIIGGPDGKEKKVLHPCLCRYIKISRKKNNKRGKEGKRMRGKS